MSMTRRRLLDDTYKQTATGNPIQVSSLARRGPGIVLYGWTEQGSTEGTNLFDIRKISANSQVSVNGEQIEIRGVSESGTTAAAAPNTLKDYAPGVKSGETYTLSLQSSSGKNYILLADGTLWENGKQKNLTEAEINGVVRFYGGGVDGIHVMTGIQIEHGEKATAYEPYTGGAPSPSPGYPQEITSAGKYNEGTGKYEYEITIANAQTDPDKSQTVTLTSERPLTKWDKLEKRNGQWGWVYKSDEYIFDNNSENLNVGVSSIGEEINSFYAEFPNKRAGGTDVFSNKFKYDYGAWGAKGHLYGFSGHPVSTLTYFEVSKDIDTYTAFRDWMIENQVSVLYETKSETFVPLSDSEQEAMNALHTFRPTTVLSNDCECNMELTYKTKKSLEVAT